MNGPRPIIVKPTETISTPPIDQAPTGNLPAVSRPTGVALSPISMDEANQFGQAISNTVGSITNKVTGVTKMGDIDEVGKGLGDLLLQARKYDPNTRFKKGILGFFGTKVAQLQNEFHTVDSAVDTLLNRVDSQINLFRGRLGDLDALYAENERKYFELDALIPQILERIEWMKNNEPQIDPNDPFEANKLNDWRNTIAYAEKRVDDLRRLQTLCQLQAPQIKMMIANANGLVSKFGELKATTIPTMKQTFALYIMNLEAKRGAEMTKAIDDNFNDTLKRNAELLGQTTRAVAQSNARSVVDFDTLQKVHTETLKTIDDVQKIRLDMKNRLQAEAPKLEQLGSEIAARLARKVN